MFHYDLHALFSEGVYKPLTGDFMNTLHCSLISTPSYSLDYTPKKIESADGTELTDWSAKPPNTVYVVGVSTKKE